MKEWRTKLAQWALKPKYRSTAQLKRKLVYDMLWLTLSVCIAVKVIVWSGPWWYWFAVLAIPGNALSVRASWRRIQERKVWDQMIKEGNQWSG